MQATGSEPECRWYDRRRPRVAKEVKRRCASGRFATGENHCGTCLGHSVDATSSKLSTWSGESMHCSRSDPWAWSCPRMRTWLFRLYRFLALDLARDSSNV